MVMQLKTEAAEAIKEQLASSFLSDAQAKGAVSKGARPDLFMFGSIPKNFKGANLVKDMKVDWNTHLADSKRQKTTA